ncbi:unnamed protein product [Acanthoscelides obtectus]|uniref:Uncharacterized protein n=1 Tax=Acanthoscelides obtectus TaxID=200917 RepID=A0A9P0JIT2_ACAOB|nr:unnamed protein product [Acanthoscelides obtectus]CAK1661322.1 hypothetical protein AOBTE_LOCUS22569 [Acanthoscelides obtectus]
MMIQFVCLYCPAGYIRQENRNYNGEVMFALMRRRIAIVISYKWYEPLLPNVPAFEEAANTNMEFEVC